MSITYERKRPGFYVLKKPVFFLDFFGTTQRMSSEQKNFRHTLSVSEI